MTKTLKSVPRSLPKVDQEVVNQIIEAKDDVDEKTAIADEARAKLNRLIVQALRTHKKSVEAHIICLDCGTIRPRNQQNCVCISS